MFRCFAMSKVKVIHFLFYTLPDKVEEIEVYLGLKTIVFPTLWGSVKQRVIRFTSGTAVSYAFENRVISG